MYKHLTCEHVNDSEKVWKKALWSNKNWIEFFGMNRTSCVWRQRNAEYDPKNTVPIDKHRGGHITLWAVFLTQGTGDLQHAEGPMEGARYETLLSSARTLMMCCGRVFQHDNNLKHIIKATRSNLRQSTLRSWSGLTSLQTSVCGGSWSFELPSSSQEFL